MESHSQHVHLPIVDENEYLKSEVSSDCMQQSYPMRASLAFSLSLSLNEDILESNVMGPT